MHLKKSESSSQKTAETNANSKKSDNVGAPVALPPRFDTNTPTGSRQTQNENMPSGLPALRPMKGVNVDALFAEKLKNPDERFGRVENAVVDLKKEFEVYKPAIVRLAAVEADIQNLIKELEVVLQETPSHQQPFDFSGQPEEATLDVKQLDPQPQNPPELDKVPKVKAPTPKKVVKYTPPPETTKIVAKQFNGVSALNFRIGEHSDKARVAFDTNRKTPFNIDIDNEEKLIIIELPEALWKGKSAQSFPGSKLFESMSVEPMGKDGSMIVLSLKKTAQILQKKILSPDKMTEYHRIYFDLKP